MTRDVWPAPVYTFLEFVEHYRRRHPEVPLERDVLDCGAGGDHPPLGLFHEHGYETHGIDISEDQLQSARAYCEPEGIDLGIIPGDMRHIPFGDERFGLVYEFYAMCHLSKQDMRLAIGEMTRVLRKGGLCFVGFMSAECWPLTGREVCPGEFLHEEEDGQLIHSVFTDDEPEGYLGDLQILWKEKRTTWNRVRAAGITEEQWLSLYASDWTAYTRERWAAMYEERVARGCYTHLFYIAQKPL